MVAHSCEPATDMIDPVRAKKFRDPFAKVAEHIV
jgi:hypothetical protein